MRLAIVAGLIAGASLAVQSTLAAHVKAKAAHAAKAGRPTAHEVAPWYIAMTADQTVLTAPVETSSAGPTKSNASHPRNGSTRLTCTMIGIWLGKVGAPCKVPRTAESASSALWPSRAT